MRGTILRGAECIDLEAVWGVEDFHFARDSQLKE